MSNSSFVLAHFSDPHLAGWRVGSPLSLINKRIFGLLSWAKKRRHIHLSLVLEALVRDLKAQNPDHVAITGDLTNISLKDEFSRAEAWLRNLGTPDQVSVVPGNHDAYIGVPWAGHLGLWADYMTGDTTPAPTQPTDFPFVRRRGPVAIIGVNTAHPTLPLFASGTVGESQRQKLSAALQQLGQENLCRVVLIHHPLRVPPKESRKRLIDGPAVIDTIAASGAELVLHGHNHRSALDKIAAPPGDIPIVGVPSASARAHHGKGHSRYHLYRITRGNSAWQIDTEVRGIVPSLDRFDREGQFTLTVPANPLGRAA